MLAADRAVRILTQLQLAKTHTQRIIEQQPASQSFAGTEKQLHGFGRLNHADDPRENPQDTALRATGNQPGRRRLRSEEHTSELQSQSNLVCRLLLEKKKKKRNTPHTS